MNMKKVEKDQKNTRLEYSLDGYLNKLRDKKLLVAFSGGRDSVALLHFLFSNLEKYGIYIYACHVNHGIRGEFGDLDEKFCRDFCSSLGVQLFVKNIDVPSYVKNYHFSVEDAARRLRYEALKDVKDNVGCELIVTAHHLDDTVENFFIKSFLGTSIENLKGFSLNDGLVRPFQSITRGDIDEYISYYKLPYVDDETNFSSDYVRNWVRLRLIPIIKAYNPYYMKNIESLQEQSDELKSYLEENIKDFSFNKREGYIETDKSYLINRHRFEQKYILNKMFEGMFRVERKHINMALDILGGDSKRVNMPDDFIFEVSYRRLRLFKKSFINEYKIIKNSTDDIVILPKLCKYIKFNGCYKDRLLTIRNRRHGDRIGKKKVKDMMIDMKLDLYERDLAIVIADEDRIVWVEYVYEKDKNIQIYKLED